MLLTEKKAIKTELTKNETWKQRKTGTDLYISFKKDEKKKTTNVLKANKKCQTEIWHKK